MKTPTILNPPPPGAKAPRRVSTTAAPDPAKHITAARAIADTWHALPDDVRRTLADIIRPLTSEDVLAEELEDAQSDLDEARSGLSAAEEERDEAQDKLECWEYLFEQIPDESGDVPDDTPQALADEIHGYRGVAEKMAKLCTEG